MCTNPIYVASWLLPSNSVILAVNFLAWNKRGISFLGEAL